MRGRRQGLSGRRGRRRRRLPARPREEGPGRECDGQLGLLDGRHRQRRDVHHDAQQLFAIQEGAQLEASRPMPKHRARRHSRAARGSALPPGRRLGSSSAGRTALRRRRRPQRPTGRSSANTPTLTGVASAPLPATLRLLWTYDAGAPSSPRPRSSTASSMSASWTASCLRSTARPASREVEVRATAPDYGIGESSPAVAGGTVYIGDLVRRAARRRRRHRQGHDGPSRPAPRSSRRRSSSGNGADRIVRRAPVRARRGDRQAASGRTSRTTTCTPRRRSGMASRISAAATRSSTACASRDGARGLTLDARVHTQPHRRRSPAALRTSARSTTKCVAMDIAARQGASGASRILTASFRSTRRRRIASGPGRDRRPRQGRARARRRDGKAALVVHDRARVDSSPAIAGDRVVIGSGDGKVYVLDLGEREASLGVRRRRWVHGVPGGRRRAA